MYWLWYRERISAKVEYGDCANVPAAPAMLLKRAMLEGGRWGEDARADGRK